MFGLEGSGFIIAVAVTLLLSGAIVYYCNTRLTSMEKAIVKQNQVLADFIGNVKLQLTNTPHVGAVPSGGSAVPANGATPEAVASAMDYYSNTTPEDKIEVSEDSQSEGDSDSESELDSSSEGSVESEAEELDAGVVAVGPSSSNGVVDIDIGVIGVVSIDNVVAPDTHEGPQITELPEVAEILDNNTSELTQDMLEVQEVSLDTPDVESSNQAEVKTITLGDLADEEELDSVTQATSELSSVNSNSNSNSLENTETNEDDGSTVNSQAFATVTAEMVKKMKVKQLRQLAVQMELGTEDGVKKIKKAALQEMIKNKMKDTEE